MWWPFRRRKKSAAKVLCGYIWSGSLHVHFCNREATRYGAGKKHDGPHSCRYCNGKRGY